MRLSRFGRFDLILLSLVMFANHLAGAEPQDSQQSAEIPGRSHVAWSVDKANQWYASIDWPVGANFVPSTASNQLEMWQAETWDPQTIERELGWAADIGMNAMRVYLHDIPWQQDSTAFLNRIDEYLSVADKHGIRTLFVFFDSVWHPHPKPGPQPEPTPGLHNSSWVQSPSTLR